jgi:hypothetical protein
LGGRDKSLAIQRQLGAFELRRRVGEGGAVTGNAAFTDRGEGFAACKAAGVDDGTQ